MVTRKKPSSGKPLKILFVASEVEGFVKTGGLADVAKSLPSALQAMGRAEVSSRVVGDMVIAGLKELDHIAYIRYAIVYLGLDDLTSIRSEIDRLLEN